MSKAHMYMYGAQWISKAPLQGYIDNIELWVQRGIKEIQPIGQWRSLVPKGLDEIHTTWSYDGEQVNALSERC